MELYHYEEGLLIKDYDDLVGEIYLLLLHWDGIHQLLNYWTIINTIVVHSKYFHLFGIL